MPADEEDIPYDEIDKAWQEHHRRVVTDDPYSDPVTVDEIAGRLREMAATGRYVPF